MIVRPYRKRRTQMDGPEVKGSKFILCTCRFRFSSVFEGVDVWLLRSAVVSATWSPLFSHGLCCLLLCTTSYVDWFVCGNAHLVCTCLKSFRRRLCSCAAQFLLAKMQLTAINCGFIAKKSSPYSCGALSCLTWCRKFSVIDWLRS